MDAFPKAPKSTVLSGDVVGGPLGDRIRFSKSPKAMSADKTSVCRHTLAGIVVNRRLEGYCSQVCFLTSGSSCCMDRIENGDDVIGVYAIVVIRINERPLAQCRTC
jgi:hypothetical protein